MPSGPTDSARRASLVWLTAGFSGMMPFATDVYLIVMPAIAKDFGASLAATQATVAAFALGFGLAHLFVGVLADRYGRRPVAVGGVLLFLVASLAVVQAPSLEWLTVYRFFQGVVIATCPILARAIIRDTVPPEQAGRTFARNNAMAAIAALAAPFLGAWVLWWGGWRGALALLILYGLGLAAAVLARLPETRPAGITPVSPFTAAGEILTHGGFQFGCLTTVLLYSALFTWLTTSPFLMIDQLGFSTAAAAMVLGIASLGYMCGSLIAARLTVRHPPERILMWGAALMLAGTITCLLALSRPKPSSLVTLIAILPFYIGLGFAHANALQITMRPFPHIAGQASAWLGLAQQIGGVLISMLAVRLGAGLAAVGVMIACCAALLLVAWALPRVMGVERTTAH